MKIKESVFLVTGGASGLGAGVARRLCSQGARVLVAEHRLYPAALKLVAEGRARMIEGKTVIDSEDD